VVGLGARRKSADRRDYPEDLGSKVPYLSRLLAASFLRRLIAQKLARYQTGRNFRLLTK
jgi:hypothetical protein